MAHPYSTEQRLRLHLSGKGERYTTLLDRNFDGIADVVAGATDVPLVTHALESIADDIDSVLGTVYETPFASVTPNPPTTTAPTYGIVATLCDIGVTWQLWFWLDPTSPECEESRKLYDAALEELLDRTRRVIPGAPLVSVATRPRRIVFESGGTEFAGGVTNGVADAAYTDETYDRTRIL